MIDKDRRTLEAMDTRELADIGISRCDLPRLYAASHGASLQLADATREEVTGGPKGSCSWRPPGHKKSLIKAGSFLSAALITWAVVHAVAQGADPTEAFLDDTSWPGRTSVAVACTEQPVGQLAPGPLNSNHLMARGTTS
jgi:hypothetical protein